MKPYELVNKIQSKHRGIAVKLAGITGRSAESFSSHGREAKTHNPIQSGNLSPVDHFITYCRQYQAATPCAGQELLDAVYATLTAEFSTDRDCDETTLAAVHREAFEAIQSGIEGKPKPVQIREHHEAIGAHARRIQNLKQSTILPMDIRFKANAAARNGVK